MTTTQPETVKTIWNDEIKEVPLQWLNAIAYKANEASKPKYKYDADVNYGSVKLPVCSVNGDRVTDLYVIQFWVNGYPDSTQYWAPQEVTKFAHPKTVIEA